jgi:hypothetical protein
MSELETPRRYKPWLFSALALVVGGAVIGTNHYHKLQRENALNFKPHYQLPSGWHLDPHGPTAIFKCTEPTTHLELRGSVNQVISDSNPTPDLDTKGIANFYIDRTDESMKGWSAAVLKTYSNPLGTDFAVIRRATKDRIVVTAYSVRGNTTLLITLFGKDRSRAYVDPDIEKLYRFLDTVSLSQQDMSKL